MGQIGSAAVPGVLPPFLFGALAVLVVEDLSIDEQGVGIAASAFFASYALTAVLGGRLADRRGAGRAMSIGVMLGAVSLLGLGTVARDLPGLVAFLIIGGVSNAVGQTATSVAVATAVPVRRHGLAFGLKQLNGPLATLMSGLLLGTVALRTELGWRAAFLVTLVVPVLYAVTAHDKADYDDRPRASRRPCRRRLRGRLRRRFRRAFEARQRPGDRRHLKAAGTSLPINLDPRDGLFQ